MWGANSEGPLGNGSISESSSESVDVTGLPASVTKLEAGEFFTCALLETGTLMRWEYNSTEQLGNGSTASSATPVMVARVSGAVKLDVGETHACAALPGSSVTCWGQNGFGERCRQLDIAGDYEQLLLVWHTVKTRLGVLSL